MVSSIDKKYSEGKEQYLELGVDINIAINILKEITVSIHCWQADDQGGFEKSPQTISGGGILTTGNYLGKPGNRQEYVNDISKAFSLCHSASQVYQVCCTTFIPPKTIVSIIS